MTWNYRLVSVTNHGITEVGIYEVYYNDDGLPISRTSDPAVFIGDSVDDVRDLLIATTLYTYKLPVLTDEEIGSNYG